MVRRRRSLVVGDVGTGRQRRRDEGIPLRSPVTSLLTLTAGGLTRSRFGATSLARLAILDIFRGLETLESGG